MTAGATEINNSFISDLEIAFLSILIYSSWPKDGNNAVNKMNEKNKVEKNTSTCIHVHV